MLESNTFMMQTSNEVPILFKYDATSEMFEMQLYYYRNNSFALEIFAMNC